MAMNQENVAQGGSGMLGQPGARRAIGIVAGLAVGIPLLYAWGWTIDRMKTNSAISEANKLGEKSLKDGDAVKALIAFNHARELRPSNPEFERNVWKARARFLADNVDRVTLENLEESRYEMERLADEQPGNATYLVAWAHILQKRGDVAEADKKLSEAVKADPHSSLAHLARAAFLQQTSNKIDEVIAEYNATLADDPKSVQAHFGLGRMYLVKKDSAKEMDEYKKALAIDPNNYGAHEALGDAYLHQGTATMPDALHQYTAAAQLQPNNPEPHWGLGLIMMKANRWKEAEAELKAAMRGKRYPEMELNLGMAIANQNRCNEAMPLFLQFLREEPNHPAGMLEVATCAARMGQKDNATAFYKKVLDLPLPAANDPQRADAEKRNDYVRTKLASIGK